MHLSRLQLQSFRNFDSLDIAPKPGINLIIGPNASGKTTLLESIYVLGHGRSFKERYLNQLIQFNSQQFTAFAQAQNGEKEVRLGLQKSLSSSAQIQVNGDRTRLLSKLAQALPLLLISPESFKWLYAGSIERRQFLDWGVFHVEHTFSSVWQQYQRVLKQRNMALKARDASSRIGWDEQLVALGETVARLRQNYWEQFLPVCLTHMEELLPISDLSISLMPGWEEGASLAQALKASLYSDQARGFTQVGPHRADLVVKVSDVPATSVLSRGQQKLLICSLYLAAGQFLAQNVNKHCIYLIDDISAELDSKNQKRVIHALSREAKQLFITGIHEELLLAATDLLPTAMFHVEHLHLHV